MNVFRKCLHVFLTLDDCVDKLRMSTVIKRIYDDDDDVSNTLN